MKKKKLKEITFSPKYQEQQKRLLRIYQVIIRNEIKDPEVQALVYKWAERYMAEFVQLVKYRGFRPTLGYYQSIRLCVTRYLSGTPITPTDFPLMIGLYKDGLPKRIGLVRPFVQAQDPSHLRVILTILSYGRSVELPIDPNKSIASITRDNPRYWRETDAFRHWVDKWPNTLKGPSSKKFYRPSCDFTEPYIGNGSGANGRPALFISIWEAVNMPSKFVKLIENGDYDVGTKIHNLRRKLIEFRKSYLFPFAYYEKSKYVDKKRIRTRHPIEKEDVFNWAKLSPIPDKEGKTRVVCTFNYWAQWILKGIHDPLLKYLEVCPWDCTFDHASFKSKLSSFSGHKYHSIDLSDATDRFPRILQHNVLEALFDKNIAEIWSSFMEQPVRHWTKNHVKHVSYSVGQPMGAYSSWPIFALTHGLVLEYLRSTNSIPKGSFVVLGDDVAISHDLLAEKYLGFLAECGIPYSRMKTMSSSSTCEFAKRWIHHGEEITPFPTNAFLANPASYPCLAEMLNLSMDRGWFRTNSKGRLGLCSELMSAHGFTKNYVNRIVDKLNQFLAFRFNFDESEEELWLKGKALATVGLSSCTNWRERGYLLNGVLYEVLKKDFSDFILSIGFKFRHVIMEWEKSGVFSRSEEDDTSFTEGRSLYDPYEKSISQFYNYPPVCVYAKMWERKLEFRSKTLYLESVDKIIGYLSEAKSISTIDLTQERKYYEILKIKSALMSKTWEKFRSHFQEVPLPRKRRRDPSR